MDETVGLGVSIVLCMVFGWFYFFVVRPGVNNLIYGKDDMDKLRRRGFIV